MKVFENVWSMYLFEKLETFVQCQRDTHSMTTFVQVRGVKTLIAPCFIHDRENSEITKKQTRQSMESAKALALDKTIQSKEERDR